MGLLLPLLLGATSAPPPAGGTVEYRNLTDIQKTAQQQRVLKRFGPSNLIVDQVPDFVNKDHESFRSFVEAYYEWMEQYQNPYGLIDSFSDLADIDRTIGLFFQDFRAMYLQGFPLQLAFDSAGNFVSEANFLKNARNFYGAKGTEKAFRFLFRILYNVSSEIKYPSKDILKCSHGKWIEPVSIKTTNTGGTANFSMMGNQVYQIDVATGNIKATATVADVIQYKRGYYDINEIFVKNITGSMSHGEPIYCKNGSSLLTETILPVISSIQIVDGGSGYQLLDGVIVGSSAENGFGANLSVGAVTKSGSIKQLNIIDSGIGYIADQSCIVVSNSGNGKARITAKIGAITNYAGYYSGNDGKLSSSKRLFDGYYYQDYSYSLLSEISFAKYKDLFKRLVHPAGFKMFGEVLIKRNLIDSLPFHSEMQRYETPFIGHYTPYRMGTTADLYSVYPNGFNPRGNTFSTYQSYGSSGGKLMLIPLGFTFNGQAWDFVLSRGSAANTIFGDVFEFARIGETYGAIYLKTIDFDLANGSIVTGAGFVEGNTLTMVTTSAQGYTATISMVRNGLGIVPEVGGFTHDTQGKPLGSSLGVEGYIEAQGLSYSYWSIYHHPNTRGIKGLTGLWNGITGGSGASMGAVAMKSFFKMPIGYHFHSNPSGTPYLGTAGSNLEYGLIESTDLQSPNSLV